MTDRDFNTTRCPTCSGAGGWTVLSFVEIRYTWDHRPYREWWEKCSTCNGTGRAA